MKMALCVNKSDVFGEIENTKELPQGNIWIEGLSFEKLMGSALLYDRSECETNPDLLQIIPYIIVATNRGEMILKYTRTEKSGEQRLHGLDSIGWGGHVEEQPREDYFDPTYDYCFERTLAREAAREINEETGLRLKPSHWRNTLHDRIQSNRWLNALAPKSFLETLRYGWVEDYFFQKLKDGKYGLLFTNRPGASQYHLAVVMTLVTDLIHGDLELSFNEDAASWHSFVQISDLVEQDRGGFVNLEPWTHAVLQYTHSQLGDFYILQHTSSHSCSSWLYTATGRLGLSDKNTSIGELTDNTPYTKSYTEPKKEEGEGLFFSDTGNHGVVAADGVGLVPASELPVFQNNPPQPLCPGHEFTEEEKQMVLTVPLKKPDTPHHPV